VTAVIFAPLAQYHARQLKKRIIKEMPQHPFVNLNVHFRSSLTLATQKENAANYGGSFLSMALLE
jgi:hypothetical protein